MSLFDFLTDGMPPAHRRPVRNRVEMQPIGDIGSWDCVGCDQPYRKCSCPAYDEDGAW